MDLTRQPPRRPSNTCLAGIAGLARLADKARAHRARRLGEYRYGEASGLDREVLAFINMTAAEFATAAADSADAQLAALVLERARHSAAAIQAFNTEMCTREPQDELHRRLLAERLARYAPERTDITTVFASMELDDWGAFRTVDLTSRPPRTPYLRTVGGVVGVARMADKARAVRAHLSGTYTYGTESGIDAQILSFLEITADAFLEAAYRHPNDDELSGWVNAHTSRTAAERSAFNAALSSRGRYAPVRERFLRRRAQICPDCTGVETWFDLLDYDDQQTFGVVDLNRRPPRSPYDQSVGGLCGLARMIDKGRAHAAGLMGEYWYGDDSGGDGFVLQFLGLSAAEFSAALTECGTDEAVGAWLGSRLERPAAEVAAFNTQLQQAGPRDAREQAFLRRQVAALDPQRQDIHTWCAWVHLDDLITFARLRSGV